MHIWKNWQYNKERGADINLNQKSRYLNKVYKDEVKEELEVSKSAKSGKKKIDKSKQRKDYRDPLE